MTDKMLQGSNDSRLVFERGITLKAAHRSNAQARNEIRIFSVGFFHAAPTRIARDVYNRRQRLMRAAHACFAGGHRKKSFNQFRIKGCCQADRLRKARRIDGGVTVQAFFMEDYRDTEATFLDKEFLKVVGRCTTSRTEYNVS